MKKPFLKYTNSIKTHTVFKDLFNVNPIVLASQGICSGDLKISDLSNAIIKNVGNQFSITTLVEIFLPKNSTKNLSCQTKCCENMSTKQFFKGIINAGILMSQQTDKVGFGDFLSYFANLTSSMILSKSFSLFDLDKEWSVHQFPEMCQTLLKGSEKNLHDYFKEIGESIGFRKNESISLFDLPSIFGKVQGAIHTTEKLRNSFVFSQCMKNTIFNPVTFHGCYLPIMEANLTNHPCNSDNSELKRCCNLWSNMIYQELLPIMKVMRMATGRGQSHFYVSDLLRQASKSENVLRYPLDYLSDTSYYNKDPYEDSMSFLPACKFETSSKEFNFTCNLFKPVITDLGVCYSFNAETFENTLKESKFRQTFQDVYRYSFVFI